MPLGTNVTQLNRTNCVGILLRAFQSNDVVKALVFMPGATDEFYFFRRARADLTNNPASLLDAVSALTNQTLIRATFRPPLLLLHTGEDLLEPAIKIEHQPTADKLRQARFVAHGLYNDRDWDSLWPVLKKSFRTELHPWPRMISTWHFYRHSFAAWNLTGWEAWRPRRWPGKRPSPCAGSNWCSSWICAPASRRSWTRSRADKVAQASAPAGSCGVRRKDYNIAGRNARLTGRRGRLPCLAINRLRLGSKPGITEGCGIADGWARCRVWRWRWL